MSLTLDQAAYYARQAGFSGQNLAIVIAIATAESGLNPGALNCNNPGGTCDRGILQINNHWHSEVSDSCAYDPACAFRQAYRISNNGTSFSPWNTYSSGAYRQYLTSAQKLGSTPGNSQNSTSTSTSSFDIPGILRSGLVKIGLFIVGLFLVILGFVLLFKKQIVAAGKTATKAAVIAA